MTIASILLRVLARSSDSLVKFVTALDATIDKFIAEHDNEIAAYEQELIDSANDIQNRIADLVAEGEDTAASIKADIEAKAHAVKVLTSLKR